MNTYKNVIEPYARRCFYRNLQRRNKEFREGKIVNKKYLVILEKVFAKEIDGAIYQSKSNDIKYLEKEGYVDNIELNFKGVIVSGYVLTLLGNITYCTGKYCSDQCKELENDQIQH